MVFFTGHLVPGTAVAVHRYFKVFGLQRGERVDDFDVTITAGYWRLGHAAYARKIGARGYSIVQRSRGAPMFATRRLQAHVCTKGVW